MVLIYKQIYHWKKISFFLLSCCVFISCSQSDIKDNTSHGTSSGDPLPSWNENNVKHAIIEYIEDVTTTNNPSYIPVADRIATFDNDGTLWSEQPVYFQLYFAIDQIKKLASDHPEWKETQPYKAILENNMEELKTQGMDGLKKIVMASHAGTSPEEFEKIVKDWIQTAKHPQKNKLFTELTYQPMIELIEYLKSKDFKVFIVSGGGLDFIRAWCEDNYGIPKEQVIGTTIKTTYEYKNGTATIIRNPEIEFIDDKEGKPLAINKYIGRKPVFACGNSDGDLQMLRWADANTFKSFKLYIHHTDSVREWAYDRTSHIGTFNVGMDEAQEKKWAIADMAKDWKVIYPE